MGRRITLHVVAGLGAITAFMYAFTASASEDADYVPNEPKGDGLFNYDGETGMNYKVNEYPKFASAIRDAEIAYGLPTDLLARVLYQESRYRPDIISGEKRSPVGATGIAQFMPETAEDYGLVQYDKPRLDANGNKVQGRRIVTDLRTDPFAAIPASARYLRALYRMFNDWRSALMAYNWGPGNVAKYNRGEPVTVPLETSQYVAQITADVNVA